MTAPADPWKQRTRFPWLDLVVDPSMPDHEFEVRSGLDRLRVKDVGGTYEGHSTPHEAHPSRWWAGARSIDQAPEVLVLRFCGSCGQRMPASEHHAAILDGRGRLIEDPWTRDGGGRVWHLPQPVGVPMTFIQEGRWPFGACGHDWHHDPEAACWRCSVCGGIAPE